MAKKQKSVALSSWESELFAAITSGTRLLGIQSELMDLGYNCSVTVATDSQSVIDLFATPWPQRCVDTRWSERTVFQEALENKKLELQKVDIATNSANVCTKALPGNRIHELCRLAWVYVCCSEEDMGDDPDEWYLSRLDELCRGEKFEQSFDSNRAAILSLQGRVVFTCINCKSQTHFA